MPANMICDSGQHLRGITRNIDVSQSTFRCRECRGCRTMVYSRLVDVNLALLLRMIYFLGIGIFEQERRCGGYEVKRNVAGGVEGE